jgi:YVTN family beta-propeller protein
VRVIWFLLKGLGAVVALLVLIVIGFYIYLATRPPGKTIKAAGIISVPAPFRFGRYFIDYMFVDGARLYVGFTSHGFVGVIDTLTNQVIATIGGLPGTHGIAVAADDGRGFATASGDNTVGVFDLSNNRILQKVPGGVDPDAIIYDEKLHLVYAGDHDGKTGTLIDPVSLKVVATLPLGGEPEYPQADPQSGLIYQNLEDTNELVVTDPQKQAVIKRYKLGSGKGPTGLAFDTANRRLFSACRNQKLVVLNADTGEIVTSLPIGALVDGVAYDASLRRVYTANAAASMTVIQQDSADSYRVLENAPTHFGGHSLVVDPMTHRIYVAYFGSVAAYDPIP